MKVSRWAAKWLDIKRGYCKPTTMSSYAWRVRRLIVPKLGKVDVGDVTSSHFRELGTWLVSKGYSTRTISGALATFKGLMRSAAMEGIVEPRDWVYELPRACDANADKRVVSIPREVAARVMDGLLATVDDPASGPVARHRKRKSSPFELECDRRRAMCCAIGLGCGLRIGEVCALRGADVDTTRHMVHVTKTAAEWVEGGKMVKEVGSTKTTASTGDVPLSMRLERSLAPHLGGGYLGSGSGSPLDRRVLRRWWHGFCDALGIDRCRFHSLRHTLGTLLVEDGADPKTVSQILRHADVTTTLKYYVHPDVETMRRPVEGLWG